MHEKDVPRRLKEDEQDWKPMLRELRIRTLSSQAIHARQSRQERVVASNSVAVRLPSTTRATSSAQRTLTAAGRVARPRSDAGRSACHAWTQSLHVHGRCMNWRIFLHRPCRRGDRCASRLRATKYVHPTYDSPNENDPSIAVMKRGTDHLSARR